MAHLPKKLLFLLAALLALNYLFPDQHARQLGAMSAANGQTITATYQKGDGKESVSETEDGTLISRVPTGTYLPQSTEYESHINESPLTIRRSIDTINNQTIVDTERTLVRFPNIIGTATGAIPQGSQISSATLKLTLSGISGPPTMQAGAYRVLENWTASQNGYLQSPSWRQRFPSTTTDENLWTNAGAGDPASSASAPLDTEPLSNTPNSVVSFDITKAVNAWVQGSPNNGVIVKLSDETSSSLQLVTFYSSEWYGASFRPLLEVTYTPPAAPAPSIPPPAPAPATTTPMPAPTATPTAPEIKPAPSPAGKNSVVPQKKGMAAPEKKLPAPPPQTEKPAPQKPMVAPTPEIQPRASIFFNIFVVIQRNIIDTWIKMTRFFR